MKRKIAVLFLAFAYSILMLHAAIPHHYHGGFFCIIETETSHQHDHHCDESHQHSHSHSHHHHSSSHEHKHHEENGKLECELSTKVVIPNNSQLSPKVAEIELFGSPFVHLAASDLLNDNYYPLVFYLNHTDKIYLPPPLYQIFIVEEKGLRAPPYICLIK